MGEFEALFVQKADGSKDDLCYQVTPEAVKRESGYRIFKYDKSFASYLMYGDKVYLLGSYFGGPGVVDARLADVEGDGRNELFFTFSSGSGRMKSSVGYFDPVRGEVVLFPWLYSGQVLVLRPAEGQGFYVYALGAGTDALPKAAISFTGGKAQLAPLPDTKKGE